MIIIVLIILAFSIYKSIDLKKHPEKRKKRRRRRSRFNSPWWNRYRAYLKSPEWKSFREHEISLAHHECQKCHKHFEHLDVHHLTYKRMGHERHGDVIVVCHKCHQKIHHRKF